MTVMWNAGENGTPEDMHRGIGFDEAAPARPSALLYALAIRAAGVAGLVLAIALALTLGSYDEGDASPLSANGEPVGNWLGTAGAMVADPLMHGLGLAAWGLVALIGVWGWRMTTARGDERIWGRLLVMPFALGAVAIFAALHAPWAGWPIPSGLGGILGNRGATAVIHSLPGDPRNLLAELTVGTALTALLLAAAALGVTLGEARAAARWLWRSAMALRGRRVADEAEDTGRARRLGPARPTGRAARAADAAAERMAGLGPQPADAATAAAEAGPATPAR
ncbi:MAG: DNA translocase FtsK 4TM domain-containing protein, partial [Pseudomonadota bacterium]